MSEGSYWHDGHGRRRIHVSQSNKRRRGVRRWVVASTQSNLPIKCSNVPDAMQQLFRWLLTGIQQVTMVEGTLSRTNAPWAEWVGISIPELLQRGLDGQHVLLHSVVARTLEVVCTIPAQAARNETLAALYTNWVLFRKKRAHSQYHLASEGNHSGSGLHGTPSDATVAGSTGIWGATPSPHPVLWAGVVSPE